jgi:hypothetical protein|tara:strand:+ start:169 stop:378 length:210 start_codon:yes stop_codon:yes gene_type:complete
MLKKESTKPELDVKAIESTGNPPRPEYRTKPRVRINGIPSDKTTSQISYNDGKRWIDVPELRNISVENN